MARQKQTLAHFEGVDEAVRNLEDIKRRTVTKNLKAAYLEGAEIVRDEASRRAPVGETGRLHEEMAFEWDSRRQRAIVGPSKGTYYGEFQEFGTSRMPAQPFLRPALDASTDQVYGGIERALKRLLT